MNKRHPWVRFSFCATPLNDTALMVLGGWGVDGALDSVQVFGLVIVFVVTMKIVMVLV